MPKAGKRLSWRKYQYINSVMSFHNSELIESMQNVPSSNDLQTDQPCTSSYNIDFENNNASPSGYDSSVYCTSSESDLDDSSLTACESIKKVKGEEDIKQKLILWSLSENINQSSLTKLLHILREHPCHTSLPADARTLLKTPRDVVLRSVAGGFYYHFGIEEGIQYVLCNSDGKLPSVLKLLVSIDGVPISKSSSSQLWPILGSLSFTISTPSVFPIGVFHGNQKPSDVAQYLNDFIVEMNQLLEKGIEVKGQIIKLELKGFICDAPARSFIMCTKGHNAYFGCSKCPQEGQYINNRVCFPEICSARRTDEDFRLQTHHKHHVSISPLLNIDGFGSVTQVPYEYMHLVCLGVMRKFVYIWLKGNLVKRQKSSQRRPGTLHGRLSPRQILEISNSLESMKSHITVEFNRKPRGFREIDRWKATKFRQLLLYTGPVVFKNVLEKDTHAHFVVLHCAITILMDVEKNEQLIDYADSLLKCFIKTFSVLYGKEYVSHNVHGLLHMCEDVRYFGSLHKYSAFQFENYMQQLKKFLRKADKSLAQVVRRILEQRNISNENIQSCAKIPFKLKKQHSEGPLSLGFIAEEQFKTLNLKNLIFHCNRPNNVCKLQDGSIVEIENFAVKENGTYLIGKRFLKGADLFEEPCPSSMLGIFLIRGKESVLSSWLINRILTKCLLLPLKEEFVVVPLCDASSE